MNLCKWKLEKSWNPKLLLLLLNLCKRSLHTSPYFAVPPQWPAISRLVLPILKNLLSINKKPHSYDEVFKLYLSTATILGVNFVFSSPYVAQCCLWTIVVFAALCGTGYHCTWLLCALTNTYRVVVKSVLNLTALKIDEKVEARKQIWYQKIRRSFKFFYQCLFSAATA
jgi:hypothetical protein